MIVDSLTGLPQNVKRFALLLIDTLTVLVSVLAAFQIISGNVWPSTAMGASWPLLLIVPAASAAVFLKMGLNRVKVVTFATHDIWRSSAAAVSVMGISFAAKLAFGLSVPVGFGILTGFLFLSLHLFLRGFGRQLLMHRMNGGRSREPVAIYGAGLAGVQLLAALRQSFEMRPVVFVDDSLALQSMTVSGLRVVSRKSLEEMVQRGDISRVLLAIPSADDGTMRALIEELSGFGCEVMALPALSELVSGTGLATSLRPVTPDHLLGRAKVDLETPEMARTYAGRRVLITGAGGSIGSELCRQIIACRPQRLTIVDHSEYALYSVAKELKPLAEEQGFELVTRLGSVCDKARMTKIIEASEIDIVLFAAAYKHVPLVEENELEGVRNNVFGTRVTAEAALEANVERFILISTDKAVRPTNIMGASKRLAELAIQDLQTRSTFTKFAMVRFGNVLGSSGSVIPLFQEQIARGGPITLTHEKVTRYFMTISEAARLVLLAGAFSEGGDVFVLDMGEPVRIADLAKRLVELSGLTVRDDNNPSGDIEIQSVGLRRGEKLYEELLIGDTVLPTPHKKILRAEETHLSEIEMARLLRRLQAAIENNDTDALRAIVETSVDGYQPEPLSHERIG